MKCISFKKKHLRGFSLIELLVVIVLIAIISVIAFINFGNQTPKARNAMRLDASGKIQTAFQIANLEEKISSDICFPETENYILSGTISGNGCHIILDGSGNSKSFLKNLKITGTFQDPTNETINGDDFVYEFNYKLGDKQNEFVYLTEPSEQISFMHTYALEYKSGSLNELNIDGNYPSIEKSISPIFIKDVEGNILTETANAIEFNLINGKRKITSFRNSSELKNVILSFNNIKYNGKTSSGNTVISEETPLTGNAYCLKGENKDIVGKTDKYRVDNSYFIGGISRANMTKEIKDTNGNNIGNYNEMIKVKCENVNGTAQWKYVETEDSNGNCFNPENNLIFDFQSKSCKQENEYNSADLCPQDLNLINVNGEQFQAMAPNRKSSIGAMIFGQYQYQVFEAGNPSNQIGNLNKNLKFYCKKNQTTGVSEWTPAEAMTSIDDACWNGGVFNYSTKTCDSIESLQNSGMFCEQGSVTYNGVTFNIWRNGSLGATQMMGNGNMINNGNINYNITFSCTPAGWSPSKIVKEGMCNDGFAFDIGDESCKTAN